MSHNPIPLSAPLKFLIVDDSRAIQAIICRAIQTCGYEPIEVETALNGEHGLDMLESFHPDLVITDWHMPKVSGLEMVQAMRQMGHQNVRVGFVTTERNQALLDEAVRNGALFILHKPFDDEELVAAVKAAVHDIVQLKNPPAKVAAEAPVTPADTVVTPASLQQQLALSLESIPFRLIPNEAMTTEQLTPNVLLGLYGAADRKGLYAIGLMDSHAVCMVGGGASRMAPAEVRMAMAQSQPDEVMLKRAREFLKGCAACLTDTTPGSATEVTLAKASVVKSNFAKLAEVLAQAGNRSDFRLSIPGYGEERMAFFVMVPA